MITLMDLWSITFMVWVVTNNLMSTNLDNPHLPNSFQPNFEPQDAQWDFENWITLQYQWPKENQGGSYHQYCTSPCYSNYTDPLLWWKDHERMEGDISKMAYDLFSVPDISAECERIFSCAGDDNCTKAKSLKWQYCEGIWV